MPTRKYLNVGSLPNDGKGDTLRDAAEKIEYNFNLLFSGSEVQNINSSGALSGSGLSILSTSVTMTLDDGTEAGDRVEIVTVTGTSTINGNFQTGSTLTANGATAFALVWTGSAWALFSNTGISVT